jgi:hypothetical protein
MPGATRQLTDTEVGDALKKELRRMTPAGGEASISINVACDVMTSLMAGLLVESTAADADDVDELVELFRRKLLDAVAARQDDVAGHG